MEFVNNPFDLVIEAVKKLYPNTKALIQFNPTLRGREFGECGCTTFPDDNSTPVVDISTNIPFMAMVEILAHELAHVVVGPGEGHDQKWESVFSAINEVYMVLGEQITKERDAMKIHVKNQLNNGQEIQFCCGDKEYKLAHEEDVTIEIQDEDVLYLDVVSQGK